MGVVRPGQSSASRSQLTVSEAHAVFVLLHAEDGQFVINLLAALFRSHEWQLGKAQHVAGCVGSVAEAHHLQRVC